MDLRAWKETETKATSYYANIVPDGKLNFSSIKKLHYQHADEYEAEDGSPSRGAGSGPMPLLEPEDDWVEELPRPIRPIRADLKAELEEESDY